MGKLEGKVAIVTGGSSGIGQAIADAYLAEGASVAVVARNRGRLERAVAAMCASTDRRFAIVADVGRVAEARTIGSTTMERFGRVDILANVAGVFHAASIQDTSEAIWDDQMDINVKGTFFCCQSVLPFMLAQGKGKIINICSVAGHRGIPGISAYAASKGAITMLTRALAAELAPSQVNVNCIVPGNIEMPSNRLLADRAAREASARRTPAGRNGRTADITPAAVYLASDDSDFVHGISLTVDGGILAVHP